MSEHVITVYHDSAGLPRWNSMTANGRRTGVSGESFSSERAAIIAAFREHPDIQRVRVLSRDRVEPTRWVDRADYPELDHSEIADTPDEEPTP